MKRSLSYDFIIDHLEKTTLSAIPTMTESIKKEFPNNPYTILISCLLSLRTKDIVTLPVSLHLFSHAITPEQMVTLSIPQIEAIISSINYYRRKAKIIHDVSLDIINRFHGQVPNNKKDLLSIKGVGLKTANLVLAEAFEIPAICVDTHVHRISNKLGIVATKTPEETELALQRILPEKYWITWSRLFVKLGQSKLLRKNDSCFACYLRQSVQSLPLKSEYL